MSITKMKFKKILNTKAKIITVGKYYIISKLFISGKFLRFFWYPVEVSLLWITPW